MEQYGHGPWQVVLVQDTVGTVTKIVTHTHIDLLLDAMYEVSKHKEKWIPLMEVGPFANLKIAKKFAREWTEGARGIDSRLLFGESLFRQYLAGDEQLCLSVLPIPVTTYVSNRQWDRPSLPPSPISFVPSIKQIQMIEKNREK